VFVFGLDATQLPFGSGHLCVLGSLSPVTAAVGNELSWTVDLSMPPHDRITLGSTRYFQALFRDRERGTAVTNLSDGLEVTFLP